VAGGLIVAVHPLTQIVEPISSCVTFVFVAPGVRTEFGNIAPDDGSTISAPIPISVALGLGKEEPDGIVDEEPGAAMGVVVELASVAVTPPVEHPVRVRVTATNSPIAPRPLFNIRLDPRFAAV
jgi:hypothetical protein